MIWNYGNRVALLKCETPNCNSDAMPFPFTWNPTAYSIRFFAMACGWSTVLGKDYCLECTENAKGAKEGVKI